jgi:hypothetical protein
MNIKAFIKKILKDTKIHGIVDYFSSADRSNSWNGPFNGQKFRQNIFLELIDKIKFAAIVETGTFRGTTTEYLYKSSGLPVYTVEEHPRYYGYSKTRFIFNNKIRVYFGDSVSFLKQLVADAIFIHKNIFVYLDAHWGDDLPLFKEVQIIFAHYPNAVIMIDDFKVPGDDGYAYDDYGIGKVLNLESLEPLIKQLHLAAFFPSERSELETGEKRGCVVIARAPDLINRLREVNTLMPHSKDF